MPLSHRLVAIFATLVLLAPANAADSPDTKTTVPGLSSPGFVFTLRMLEDGVFPNTLSGFLDIKNTQDKAIKLTNVTITPYGRLGGVYEATTVFHGDQLVGPQISSPAFRGDFKVVSDRKLTIYDAITARTGPVEFIVEIEYFPKGEFSPSMAQAAVTATVGTSPLYVFYGGAVGAVLLVLFLWSNKVLTHAKAGTLGTVLSKFWPLTAKWFCMLIAYIVSGPVVALILWILANGLTAFQLPIAFQLRDFSGGMIVGLFSGMLAKAIVEKLNLD